MLNRTLGSVRGDRKVVAVFVNTAQEAAAAVAHLTSGDVRLPILLYSREAPFTEEAFARVVVEPRALVLLGRAIAELSGQWVALGVVVWNGNRADWLLKIAPFLFPPFRVLVMNEHSDFFSGRPAGVAKHWRHRTSSLLRTSASWARGAWNAVASELRTGMSWLSGTSRQVCWTIAEFLRDIYIPGPFEFFGQFSSPLSRKVFSFFKGTELLAISARHKRESGVVVIHLTNGEWRRPEIMHALENPASRWVIFQETGVPEEPCEDMLSLFAENRTFAVARQVAYRGWLESVLPTAPFRALQPDEATQVLAPLSTQIVFDREKLLALGLPNLKSAPANLLLLFWRAAAAGWRSYSVGSRQTVHQLAAMPVAEAQFVQALINRRSLSRLQPRDGELVRGNVVSRTKGRSASRGRLRVLIVSPFLPYPLSHGGAVRIYNLCRLLSRRFDLVLACFGEKNDVVDYAHLHEVFREVYVVGLDEVNRDPALPDAVAGYESSSMRALIHRICTEHPVDLVQIEYTQMASYREAAPNVPAILVEHDITFSLYRQLAERDRTPAALRQFELWKKFESERLQAYDAVWTMSEGDRDLALNAGACSDLVTVVPNGVDIETFRPSPEPQGLREILFVGSFRHLPNYLAFEELCERIMPVVWETLPNVTLRVVAGPRHEEFWRGSENIDPRITVHGFVSDIASLYRNCTIAVAPLPVSAGTNIKVTEALASARAIVTTPAGCAGLGLRHRYDAMVCDLPSFARGICEVLNKPVLRNSIGRHARATAEERFSWESIQGRAADSYLRILGEAEAAVA